MFLLSLTERSKNKKIVNFQDNYIFTKYCLKSSYFIRFNIWYDLSNLRCDMIWKDESDMSSSNKNEIILRF